MLKILSMQKQRTALQVQLKSLRTKRTDLLTQETALRAKLDALPDDASIDQIRSVNDEVTELTRQQTECEDSIESTNAEIEQLDTDIAAAESSQRSVVLSSDPHTAQVAPAQRTMIPVEMPGNYRCRSGCFSSRSSRDAFYARSEVKDFLARVRTMLGGNQPGSRRSVTGANLSIPTDYLDVIRDNLNRYSKLIGLVRLHPVSGTARQNIMGDIPEGIWMEMAGALNELEFTINQLEVDGYKVGGVICIPNTYLQDSDINLGEEILFNLAQSIGYALDKAIVYGRGPGSKMPTGIVTRLAQTSQPTGWGTDRAAWTDLHTSNVLTKDGWGVELYLEEATT